jgi:hypothetical protein
MHMLKVTQATRRFIDALVLVLVASSAYSTDIVVTYDLDSTAVYVHN